MDDKIQAALIGAIAAIIGVLIGGYIQAFLKDREIRQSKKIAEGAACLYLCKLRDLFYKFSEEKSTFLMFTLGIGVNENNIQEIDKVIDLIEKHDAFLLVKLFDVRQLLGNLRIYSTEYYKKRDADESYSKLQRLVGTLNIDGRRGLKEIEECIKHTFNNSENETRKTLLANPDFHNFLAIILGDRKFHLYLLKLGLANKIK